MTSRLHAIAALAAAAATAAQDVAYYTEEEMYANQNPIAALLAPLGPVLFVLAMVGSFLNALSHAAVAFMLVDTERGRQLWQGFVPGCAFEPSIRLFYALTVNVPELWSVLQYVQGAPDATKRVLAFQIFVLGGGSAYRLLVLASPRDADTHFKQMICFEWLFVAGLVFAKDVGATLVEALKVYVGCKLAGFAWSWLVAGAMRALGLCRFAAAPPPKDGTEKEAAEGDDDPQKKQ